MSQLIVHFDRRLLEERDLDEVRTVIEETFDAPSPSGSTTGVPYMEFYGTRHHITNVETAQALVRHLPIGRLQGPWVTVAVEYPDDPGEF